MYYESVQITGDTFTVDSSNIKSYIALLEDHIASLNKPFIYDCNSPFFHLPASSQHTETLYGGFRFLRSVSNLEEGDFEDVLENMCNEDEEWTRERNKKYKYLVYRKFIFKEDAQKKIKSSLEESLHRLKETLEKWEDDKKRKQIEKQKFFEKYSVSKTHALQIPKGGEYGQDGFFDGEIKNNQTGETERFIAKNIFDFGFIAFPREFADSDNVFKVDEWTEEQKAISRWLVEFSPFSKNIRL